MSSVQFLNNNNGLFVVNSGSEIGLFNLKQREQSANFNYEEPKSHIPGKFALISYQFYSRYCFYLFLFFL